MEILLLFVTFVAYLVFSYIGIWTAAKLTEKKKLAVQKQLTLFVVSIGAMAAAFFRHVLFYPARSDRPVFGDVLWRADDHRFVCQEKCTVCLHLYGRCGRTHQYRIVFGDSITVIKMIMLS
jgi:hypothetical protein